MAIRYVKDFEFPSAAGFTSSAPSQVTGPMFAKGGKVEKEPKGMMVIIGVGKPKHDAPMEKAKGGKVGKVMHEFGEGKLHSGSKKGPEVTNPKQAIAIALSEAGKSKKGYAEGGKAVKVPLPTEEEAPYPAQWPMPSDEQMNKENWNQRKAIRRAMGAKNTGKDTFAKGGDVKSVPVKDIKSGKIPQSTDEDFYGKAKDAPMPPRRPSMLKKGGMPHEDVKEDTALIKSMIKPAALKKAMGGQAVQMAKSNAVEASMKGQKKTPYADGGMALAAPQVASPLQQMARKSVPVAPRAPMIPQQAAPAAGAPRIGVGRSRSGKPNVGAIRAAMARAATQATPENAPGMMKKGGKVGC